MTPLVRLVGLIGFALRRVRHHPGLTLLALAGVILSVGLVTNASFFSAAVEQTILDQQLAEFHSEKGRSAFSIRTYDLRSPSKPMSLEEVEGLAPHVASTLSSEIGLSVRHVGIEVDSGSLKLQPREETSPYSDDIADLGSVSLAYKSEVENHLEIVEGEPLDDGASGEVLDVWMNARLAEHMGIHPGEEFKVAVLRTGAETSVRVRGFWKAQDATDPFWFSDPGAAMKGVLLVRRHDYISHVQPIIPSQSHFVAWHVTLDDTNVTYLDTQRYLHGFERGMFVINQFIPDARMDTPPLELLREFVQRQSTLTILLLSFNVPAFGFLLYFLILTSAIIARWRRRETAVLVGRGISFSSVLGLTLIEEMLLFIVGCPLGIGLGMLIARLMGYTSSFLSFTSRPPMPVSLLHTDVRLTLVTLGVSLIARLLPADRSARRSVVEVEQEQARPLRRPFWYRSWLDLLLILPTAYAYQQLSNRGTLALLVRDRPEDLYRDPLLILVPALFILAAALATMRFFPLVMRMMDGLANLAPWITPHLALRQLGRQSQGYMNPLLLIMVSLGLGTYTLSMAASLDQWLVDRMYYRVGTDLTFEPYPQDSGDEAMFGVIETIVGGDWIPLPYEFRDQPGVEDATRVGDYQVEYNAAGGHRATGRFLAIDRAVFPSVGWFRHDFAGESLGALTNRLALPEGILVSRQFLSRNALHIGAPVPLRVVVKGGLEVVSTFTVMGTYDYFPTVYEDEDDGMTIIGNLDYLSTYLGVTARHHIWLRTQEHTDGEIVLDSVEQMGIDAYREKDARQLIAQEQARLERVGIFGTLSVGFVAAAITAAVGLLTHSYASLRERLYRFTVLRAVGLMHRQIVTQVIMEYAFLMAYGAIGAASIGMATSRLFTPFFRVTGETGIPLPPLVPIVAEEEVWMLATAFIGAMVLVQVSVVLRALSQNRYSMLRSPIAD